MILWRGSHAEISPKLKKRGIKNFITKAKFLKERELMHKKKYDQTFLYFNFFIPFKINRGF